MKQGFTLIECLVAVLILAIVLASSARAIGIAISDVRDSYTREAANWIVQNQQAEISLLGKFSELGVTKKNISMAGIDFLMQTTVTATPNPVFRRVDVAVATTAQPNYIIFRTVDFVSQY